MSNGRCFHFLLLGLFLLAGVVAFAETEAPEFAIRGSLKTFINAYDLSDFLPDRDQNNEPLSSGVNRLIEGENADHARFRLLGKPSSRFSYEGAYELIAVIQGARQRDISAISDQDEQNRLWATQVARSFAGLTGDDTERLPYRAIDLDRRLSPANQELDAHGRSFLLYQNLDRASVTWSSPTADITAGRQPVAFGSARVINPTDILTPFTYTSLDREERIGVDALRVRVPLGSLSQADAGIVCGKDCDGEESAAFLRMKWHALRTDIALIIMTFRENVLLGLDLARSIRDAGAWFEAAQVYAGALGPAPAQEDYWRVSTGADYNFTGEVYGFIEYHYNGPGKTRSSEYAGLIGTRPASGTAPARPTAYEEGGVYLLGRHYLSPGATWQATPLLSLSAKGLYNVLDRSALLSPGIQYSVSDEAVLEAGAFIGTGKKPLLRLDTVSGNAEVAPRSEFGLSPDRYYITVRMFF